jgi:chaperonin GroEL (HSP60 family)
MSCSTRCSFMAAERSRWAVSGALYARAAATGVEAGPFRAVADALEVIPCTLVQNAGGNAIWALTALRVRLHPFAACSFFYFPPFLTTSFRQNMLAENNRGALMARRVRLWI